MNILKLLFSFKGRIPRAQWWGYMIPYALGAVCLLLVTGSGSFADSDVTKAYVFVTTYTTLAVGAKRCHDHGYSGWLMLLAPIPLVDIGLLVVLGFLRGNEGTNKYGPAPGYSGALGTFQEPGSTAQRSTVQGAWNRGLLIGIGALAALVMVGTMVWLASNGATTTLPKNTSSVIGDVENGSVRRVGNTIYFGLVSDSQRLTVAYVGLDPLPDTFKDGVSIVADGTLNQNKLFRASKVTVRSH